MQWKRIFPQDSKGGQFFAPHLNLLLLCRHFQMAGSVKAMQEKKKKLLASMPVTLEIPNVKTSSTSHHILHAPGAFQKAFLSDAVNRLLLQIWMPGTESTVQMTESWGKWVVEYRKKQEINSQKFYLCFSASVWPPPPTLALCPSPPFYFTSSFPCYPLVKEAKFTKIVFPLVVHYVTVLGVLSGLPWPRLGCHPKPQKFFLSAFSASPSINSHPI